MCGRYGFSIKDQREVYERFAIENDLAQIQPRFNIAPGQMNPVISIETPNTIEPMFWGLIPYWARDDSFKFKTINARVEGVHTKPVYRKSFATKRALIPATGFYEWDKSQKPSVPHYFKLKDNKMFAFAGLYDIWKDPKTGQELKSYTILTREANDIVSKVHPRMPIILSEEAEKDWLNPDIVENDHVYEILNNLANNQLESHPVSKMVNIPSNDTPDLIVPV